jgi:hypothetical protein
MYNLSIYLNQICREFELPGIDSNFSFNHRKPMESALPRQVAARVNRRRGARDGARGVAAEPQDVQSVEK